MSNARKIAKLIFESNVVASNVDSDVGNTISSIKTRLDSDDTAIQSLTTLASSLTVAGLTDSDLKVVASIRNDLDSEIASTKNLSLSYTNYIYNATAGQTSFTGSDANGNTLDYTVGAPQIFLNGIKLDADDFTATNGTSIVLSQPAGLSHQLSIIVPTIKSTYTPTITLDWSQTSVTTRLYGDASNEAYARFLDLSGDYAAVGSTALYPNNHGLSSSDRTGGVYIYKRSDSDNGTAWQQTTIITKGAGADQLSTGDQFGSAVVLNDDATELLVSSVNLTSPGTYKIFLYTRSGESWSLTQTIDQPDGIILGSKFARFGTIERCENYFAVGAPNDEDDGFRTDTYGANVVLALPFEKNMDDMSHFISNYVSTQATKTDGPASSNRTTQRKWTSPAYRESYMGEVGQGAANTYTPSTAIPSSATGTFVIEGWFYSTNGTANANWAISSADVGGRFLFGINNSSTIDFNGSSNDANDIGIGSGWHHIAIVCDGGTKRFYLDGIYKGAWHSPNTGFSTLHIGQYDASDPNDYQGFIQDFKVTIGTVRGYTGTNAGSANFTLPGSMIERMRNVGFPESTGSDKGSVFVYYYYGGSWSLQARLIASDRMSSTAGSDEFGMDFGFVGDSRIIVGAKQHHIGVGQDNGAAYVFERSGTTWTQVQKISPPTNDKYFMGFGVSASGDYLALGATRVGPSDNNTGRVLIYKHNGSSYVYESIIQASDGGSGHYFGGGLQLRGDVLIVGAYGNHSGYIFTRSGTTWTEKKILHVGHSPHASYGLTGNLKGGVSFNSDTTKNEILAGSTNRGAWLFTLES